MSGQVAGPAWLINAVRRAGEAPMRRWMRSQVDDPVIREKLIPRYGLGCKRPSMSNEYLKTFNRDDVSLITESIECVTPDGVRTVDGVEHVVDVLICATGFRLWDKGSVPPFLCTAVVDKTWANSGTGTVSSPTKEFRYPDIPTCSPSPAHTDLYWGPISG